MDKLRKSVESSKYWRLSLLLLIGAIIVVVIKQVDYLSKFATTIVALALLVASSQVDLSDLIKEVRQCIISPVLLWHGGR